MDWQEISGSWVLIPRHPIAIVHFLGGAFVATAPQLTYRWLLEQLGQEGYVVIATPFTNGLDHKAIARNVLNRFESVFQRLHTTRAISDRSLPIYGIGHSMGCKLHLLIGSLYSVERAGNILISYNNYPARQAIPFIEQFNLAPAFDVEFTPSPEQTNELVAQDYEVRRNLLIKFSKDDIDQTLNLTPVLQGRFPNLVAMQKLPGNHLTPLSQQIDWQAGEKFTPLDAFAQWVKQEFSQDMMRLKQEILLWLNPVLPTQG
ncbi:MAG: hypothetical protein BRC47_09455 [Cyanobacteria bacterium QS_7_48_42]|jgi:hypothetical protein|nr:MAG: hypothetical protein BRC36_08890 [Cyanobacteria bacterium QH_2_48_84]PSO76538.1 MAG: hypothetical protein BRC37_03410 [Cyanobacteria bacterium QH_3_48_40]PSO84126.1 MAG: hypothetical protein BRC45_06460 [Cyanobacteria bacterium QS_5_48_63]PSO95137.1 MAG: hypothetical protein BRC46_03445 [Cyanobacteria bacterium QS_6_48_18]PSP01491.1 MAG: hypothetical protein BRC47_09455 [Cyanobacteria bacterium QS_7_48_42]PSP04009.1 MAG: hypothetical protein BRC51_08685 [Cyanobacteria bacterium SW_12_4